MAKYGLILMNLTQAKYTTLLSQGYAAGIVIANDGHPARVDVNRSKSDFSVYVGNQKMQGVTQGNRKEMMVRYISTMDAAASGR